MKMMDNNQLRVKSPLEIMQEYDRGGGAGMEVCPEKSARIFFESWINNNMAVLLMLAEYKKQKPREKQIEKLLCFLDSIETYYVFPEQAPAFINAIDCLREYLNDYPLVDAARSAQAVEMIRHLYRAMGFPMRNNNLNYSGRPE